MRTCYICELYMMTRTAVRFGFVGQAKYRKLLVKVIWRLVIYLAK